MIYALMIGYFKKNLFVFSLIWIYLTLIFLNSVGLEVWLPSCPVKTYLDVECFGCGLNRAFIALMKFNFTEAWTYNPLIFIYLPVGACWIIYDFYKYWDRKKFLTKNNPNVSVSKKNQ